MPNQHDFFIARAAEARDAAAEASLANVRDRCLRSEAAWTAMAERAGRAARNREQPATITG